ncbi:microvitellogenin-like [Manduca sexta]|uniref:microvitellogenin-like n=1 Tax=Manduca sexta TaxID=7130 RepID=UPI00188EA823|nr:microvitellogenin-like [Manduca sexta]
MLRITFLVVLTALACQAASEEDSTDDNYLYNSIIVGDYEVAVSMTKDLVKDNKLEIISTTVQRLINENQRNLVDYAYYLWKEGGEDIVKKYFPLQFRIILGQHAVKLLSMRDNMVVKLGYRRDSDGDRTAYGDANHMIGDRMAWKFIPVEDSQLYFKIYHPLTDQYLKLGLATNSDGDHEVFGGDLYDSYRFQFFLIPAMNGADLVFYIFNREYQQALKLSRAVDSDGDRQVFSEKGNVLNDTYSYGWKIKPL